MTLMEPRGDEEDDEDILEKIKKEYPNKKIEICIRKIEFIVHCEHSLLALDEYGNPIRQFCLE